MKMAAEQGNVAVLAGYGLALVPGQGVTKNVEEGMKYLKMAIAKGDLVASYYLGLILIENGNVAGGCVYIKAAANRGVVEARNVLTRNCSHIGDDLYNGGDGFR
jgi:TPR repeat protein